MPMQKSNVCKNPALDNALNSPALEERFSALGLGLFIHWSVDSAYSLGLSHWMCGASRDIIDKYVKTAPAVFHPKDFDADDWAWLAKVSGMRYAVLTTKHHNGFCMYDTKTTAFNIMNTPFRRDIVREFTEAMRRQGIVPGYYFSPLDFLWCHQHGIKNVFNTPPEKPENNPGLLELDRAQVTELMTQYGDIGMVFFDGPSAGLRELVREYQPGAVITRGVMETPEQNLPDEPFAGAWEACYTLGESWGYTAAPEKMCTPTELIELLIRIRAGGGNLLINVSPDGRGRIPWEQERILTELGLFLFFNDEGIYEVEPWCTQREGNIWYTKKRGEDTVYAFVCGDPLPYGADYAHNATFKKSELRLKSVRASENSVIEVLGQNGQVVEHMLEDRGTTWYQNDTALYITATRGLRPHENSQWPHPWCVKITHARTAQDK